jgi:hypothetical protein
MFLSSLNFERPPHNLVSCPEVEGKVYNILHLPWTLWFGCRLQESKGQLFIKYLQLYLNIYTEIQGRFHYEGHA